jgi:Zn-dependent M28 family amino/carboxypeptidase
MVKHVAAAACASVLLAGCSTQVATRDAGDPVASSPTIRASAIEAHIRYLADDLLEGREAGTRGYDLAAGYVAAQFRLLGLEPAGRDGSYFQSVPLRAHWVVREGARLNVRAGTGAVRRLALGEDYLVSSSPIRAESAVSAPAAFVGYGIEAPRFKHNDYEGVDLKGKVAVVLAGYPRSFPSEEGAHYGSGREKGRIAAARGAVGVLTIYTPRYEKVSPWDRNRDTLDQMSMAWIGPDGQPFVAAPPLQVTAVLSPQAGAALFDGAPRSYQDVRTESETGAPKAFPLAVTVDLAQRSRHEPRASTNVAAVLKGSDAALAAEHVVMLGHLDHEGLGPAVNGDAIYNGALDNAAGIAGLLEAARALASEPVAPKRSVLFLAVTAEEKGLLGSEYFALNPTVPRESIVAAVNLDMPVLLYDFTDVIAFGAEHSTLKSTVEAALKQANITLSPDPMPDEAVFTRSDHYRFVQQGVPSIFLSTGWNTAAGAGEGGKAFTNFLATAYHRPSDDMTQAIDYRAGARFAHVNYLILKSIADAAQRPAWNAGDFFGELFGRVAR